MPLFFQSSLGPEVDRTITAQSWSDVPCHESISQIFYRNDTSGIEKEVALPDRQHNITDRRDAIRAFLDDFIMNYFGPMEVANVLSLLIARVRKFPSIQNELQWLQCTQRLQKHFFAICNEESIQDFVPYFTELNTQFSAMIGQHPDDFSKVGFVMKQVVQDPEHYKVFREFCKGRQSLEKYFDSDLDIAFDKLSHVS